MKTIGILGGDEQTSLNGLITALDKTIIEVVGIDNQESHTFILTRTPNLIEPFISNPFTKGKKGYQRSYKYHR
jgi:hypothetical protein